MKKGFIAFVKASLGVAKVVLAILGVLVLAVVASLLLSIPGGKRFSRYCSYPDMKALMDAERDDIVATVAYERGGTNYTFVVLKPCRFLASGCAVLVYDPEGRLFDKTGDEGDDGCFQRAWPRPWCWRDAKTVRRLKAITMPEVYFYAPATMKDFVEYMGRATKRRPCRSAGEARNQVRLHTVRCRKGRSGKAETGCAADSLSRQRHDDDRVGCPDKCL